MLPGISSGPSQSATRTLHNPCFSLFTFYALRPCRLFVCESDPSAPVPLALEQGSCQPKARSFPWLVFEICSSRRRLGSSHFLRFIYLILSFGRRTKDQFHSKGETNMANKPHPIKTLR